MLLYEMLAGRSPFDIVGATDNPDQNTEDYLFQVRLGGRVRQGVDLLKSLYIALGRRTRK